MRERNRKRSRTLQPLHAPSCRNFTHRDCSSTRRICKSRGQLCPHWNVEATNVLVQRNKRDAIASATAPFKQARQRTQRKAPLRCGQRAHRVERDMHATVPRNRFKCRCEQTDYSFARCRKWITHGAAQRHAVTQHWGECRSVSGGVGRCASGSGVAERGRACCCSGRSGSGGGRFDATLVSEIEQRINEAMVRTLFIIGMKTSTLEDSGEEKRNRKTFDKPHLHDQGAAARAARARRSHQLTQGTLRRR